MAFFRRNDPSAPARRAAQGQGGPNGPYHQLANDSTGYPYQQPQPPNPRQNVQPAAYGQNVQPAAYGGYAPAAGRAYQNAPYTDYPEKDYRAPPPLPQRNQYSPQAAQQGAGTGTFAVANCPSDFLALTNRLVINPNDFPPDTQYVRVRGKYVISVTPDNTGSIAPGSIGPSSIIRKWIGLSISDRVDVEPYQTNTDDWASTVELEVSFRLKRKETSDTFDCDEMSQTFVTQFNSIALTAGQPVIFDYKGHELKAVVRNTTSMEGRESKEGGIGLVMEATDVIWVKDPVSPIKLKASSRRVAANPILAPNFRFEDMGIGGLDAEFASIFRRAFVSRLYPPGLVTKMGIPHVKGILLYGPPGTGKTLMARQIGKMLNANEPKIVNGPEILNKYVGQSEENIRKLFADAEKEQKEKGDESSLHIIIFDELDAICKQRGSTNSGTGVGDTVVNQLLSKMDGVEQLNNVLIIGMTNRKDMIDEALMRPGRLEVHIEVSLPDESGRLQILNIHTSSMREHGLLDVDVSLAELASLTKNFSGAEISGLVKSATSFALNREVKIGGAVTAEAIEHVKVIRDDFMHALEEVQPAFGVSEEELQQVVPNGIIKFSGNVDSVLNDAGLLVQQVRKSERTPLVTALLHGPPMSGKTALAASIALQSDFPFIKLISAEPMIGMTESQKISHVHKVFMDAYKSRESVIVVDALERILDWNPIGPRFSNGILQALVVLFAKQPPKGRRLLILATTSNKSILSEMDVLSVFDAQLQVLPIDSVSGVERCLREVQTFPNAADLSRLCDNLSAAGFGDDLEEGERKLQIGVKKLLTLAEMARYDPDPVSKLTASLISESS